MFFSTVYNSSEFFITIIVLASCIAVAYKRLTGETPGGIVPIGATIIVLIRNPLWAVFCVSLSFLGFWLYLVLISRINNREGFSSIYFIAFLTMSVGIGTAYVLQWIGLIAADSMIIGGLVVPAILANQFRVQGIKSTVIGFTTCIGITFALVLCLIYIANAFGASEGLFAHFQTQHIPMETRYLEFYPLPSLFSLIFGYFVYKRKSLRSGGYIMAPLAAQLFASVNTSLIFVAGLLCLYLLQLFLSKYTLIIGLHRYLANIVSAAVFTWLSILYIQQILSSGDARFLGSAWILVLVLASYSTDLYIYRYEKSYLYIALNTLVACSLVAMFQRA